MGIDYVYISKGKDPDFYVRLFMRISEVQDQEVNFKDDECANTTMRMLCHYYFPPCGNSTHYEQPTSVCPAACEALKKKCNIIFDFFQSKLMEDQIQCSKSIIDPLPHLCSNLDISESG